MLSHCSEKMVLLSSSSPTNEWPQNNQMMMRDDQNPSLMEKPPQDHHHQQQQQEPLRCPRCDSSNTKFCYYNNYSLSQPRHFCKACKRYWTRGGTLRNVPVGGGCRKNKRVKRPPPTTSSAFDAPPISSTTTTTSSSPTPQIDLSSSSNHLNSTSFFSSDFTSIPFSRFGSGYEHMIRPQINGLDHLGFSSGSLSNGGNGFSNIPTSISSYSSMFSNPSPTIASLLASKFINGGIKDARGLNYQFHNTTPFDHMDGVIGGNEEAGNMMGLKEVKVEGQNRNEWSIPNCQNPTDQIGLSEASLYWNSSMGANWNEQGNIGSSVTSLI